MTSPFSLEDTLPLPLHYEPEQLPHHTNVERLERRIFEVHAYWRHNATLVTSAFLGFVAVNLVLVVGLTLAQINTNTLIGIALTLLVLVTLSARILTLTQEGILRSDRNINAMEVEIQKITGSPSYILNNEVMPLDFYRKTLGIMRAVLYLLLPLWVLLPTLPYFFPTTDTPIKPTKPALLRQAESPRRSRS